MAVQLAQLTAISELMVYPTFRARVAWNFQHLLGIKGNNL
jgi:hypothetical protein